MKIAISGKSGCGNSSVSKMVADRLGLRLINYTFRTMAQERGMSFQEFSRLAEDDTSYDRMLDKRQVEMAMEGDCVLGSRLAIWLLKEADLRVYLTASVEVRAERIGRREGKSLEIALTETVDRDKRDRARYLKLYEIDNDEYEFADLVIDTERREAYEVAALITEAARAAAKRQE
ncbi:MAG TPA: AAA family ATPase [Spirochaetia bacterium]|nr:AAA family ATPase [Spirochaetia bacterium]